MNLDQYEWSPTMIAFDSNPDNTAKSTSWHVYNVSIPSTPKFISCHFD